MIRRRDFGGEIIAAIAAVALLSFAITFGILLSVSDPDSDDSLTETPVETVIAESNVGEAPETEEITLEVQNVDITEEATEAVVTEESPTPEPDTETPTESATETEDASETPTEVAVTPSITPTEAVTEEPTTTATDTTEATSTEQPTRTPRPSRTPTDTQESPTETNTPRPSRTPTKTEEPTASNTPTEVATRIAIITVTNTPSLEPTIAIATDESLGILPTPTLDETSLPTQVALANECSGAPAEWPAYIVQRGNTLYSIALAVDSTVEELSAANCIADVNAIRAGVELFVPRLPEGAIQTTEPGIQESPDESDQGLESVGCVNPLVQITNPSSGASINSVFDVVGTASWPDFQYYKLEIRANDATTYNFYSDSTQPVNNGLLGTIDRSLFEAGVYWVRLVVVDVTGNVPNEATCAIPMIFE